MVLFLVQSIMASKQLPLLEPIGANNLHNRQYLPNILSHFCNLNVIIIISGRQTVVSNFCLISQGQLIFLKYLSKTILQYKLKKYWKKQFFLSALPQTSSRNILSSPWELDSEAEQGTQGFMVSMVVVTAALTS